MTDPAADLASKLDADELWWITYGKDGRDPPERRRLRELDADHLAAILRTCRHIGPIYVAAIRQMLER